MENVNPILLDVFSQLLNRREVYPAFCFDDVGTKAQFLGFAAKWGIEAGIVPDNRHQGFNFFGIQMLDERENPALGAIEAGWASKLQDTDFIQGHSPQRAKSINLRKPDQKTQGIHRRGRRGRRENQKWEKASKISQDLDCEAGISVFPLRSLRPLQ
jgi:hypothetical protein